MMIYNISVHSYPFIGISIGLCVNRQPVMGVIFNPVLNELYTAIKGKGSYLNGNKINVSKHIDLKKSLISSNFPYDRSEKRLNTLFKQFKACLVNHVHGIRTTGSAVINFCHVASGKLEAYFGKIYFQK